MRFLVRLSGWLMLAIGVAELLWIGITVLIVSWNTGGYLAGIIGKLLSVVLFPLDPLLILYQGFAFREWGLVLHLLIVGPAVSWILICAGSYLCRVGKRPAPSAEEKILPAEEAASLAKSMRERLNASK